GSVHAVHVDTDVSHELHTVVDFPAAVDHVFSACRGRSGDGIGLALSGRLDGHDYRARRAVSFVRGSDERNVWTAGDGGGQRGAEGLRKIPRAPQTAAGALGYKELNI